MFRRCLVACIALTVVAGACGAKGADDASPSTDDDEVTQPTDDSGDPASTGDDSVFGTLDSPCGEGSATVAAADAGSGTDKLYVGVANERTFTARNGLLKELWDAGVAFSEWCNSQGGIAGLQIELVDMDGQVSAVEAAMAKGCAEAFAMVGGGFAQDQLIFTGKPESDFHQCKMIAIPGFAVSTDFSEANGLVQPIPNPVYEKPTSWMVDLKQLYPDEMEKFAVVWGNLSSLEANKEQNKAVAESVDGVTVLGEIQYDALSSTQDWSQVAQQVMNTGARAINFVGEPGNAASLSEALKVADYDGIMFTDANIYDPVTIEAKGAANVEGLIARIASHPYEEADKWPATKKLLDVLNQFGPDDVKIASLSVQSVSAWLLFATSVKTCAEDGEITRDCVLGAALDTHKWDGGGLHAVDDPGANVAPECAMLMSVQDGEWKRLFPEIGSDDDDGEGFSCNDLVEIEGDLGQGNVDSSRTV